MVDEDSILLDDFSRLINYWIFLPLFVVLRGKSFFTRSSSILFLLDSWFFVFQRRKACLVIEAFFLHPFFPKIFLYGVDENSFL